MKIKKIILLFVTVFTIVNIYAQTAEPSEYNYQRRSLFEILPVTSSDIIFIGNSITDGCEWSELFNNLNVKNRGISADRTYWMLERLDYIIKGKPLKLFVLAGINDLGAGHSPQSVTDNIAKLIDRFQTESPETELYIESIFPVNNDFGKYANHGSKGKEIIEANELLKQLCTQKGITFVDVYSKLVDESGKLNKEYTNDGLHLMGAGYLVWKKVIEKYLNTQTGFTTSEQGVSFSLQGRSVSGGFPKPAHNLQKSGKVVVEIRVDQNGKVTYARATAKGSTLQDATLWKAAEDAARRARFNVDKNAAISQMGTITYNF
ncbi:MAG: TonB family protein [Prevotellaceae bacterium]|jgi:TonB family protein|nr:TonB family protein [Prevotellaceae bacterium]